MVTANLQLKVIGLGNYLKVGNYRHVYNFEMTYGLTEGINCFTIK